MDISQILAESSFEVRAGAFRYHKLTSMPETSGHLAVVSDGVEVTVVTDNWEGLDYVDQHPVDYIAVCLHVNVPFYSVGFLAAVTTAVAKQDMNVLVLSTFSFDYILVAAEKADVAIEALKKLGLHEL